MRRYRSLILSVALLLTLSGQVLALAMHCPEQEMATQTVSMEMSCHGQSTKPVAAEMEDDGASVVVPLAPALACDLLCGFCLHCNSLAGSTSVTALVAVPALNIDERQPSLLASSLENPFRPPITT